MNLKYLLPALMLGSAIAAQADGYTDGIEYYKAGQYDNARTILERNLNAPATDQALAYYYLGQTALAQGDKAAAKADFEKGIAAKAECPYNYVGIGAIDLLNGNLKAAEEQFKLAQKYGKKNHEITVDIARAYYNADPVKYDPQVKKFLEKAHKDSKHNEPSIYILEGDMLFNAKELGNAAGKYEQAIMFDDNNPEGYVKYANAYIGVNPQFSIQKLEELNAKQPTSALAQRELAEKYYETSQWTKAAQQYGKYIQNPNHFPEDKARYAVLLYANGEYQKSLDIANQLLREEPNNFVMQRIRMLDLASMERNNDVVAAAESFFALPQNDKEKFTPNDYITYAGVLEKLGQDSIALIQYEGAVAVDPTRVDNLKQLSTSYVKNGKYEQAAETYSKIIEMSEDPSLNDYFTLSGRWLTAANRAESDEARIADCDKALAAVNTVIDQAATILPEFYQRQGQINYIKAQKADENVFNSYTKVLEILDADPENANPANPANKLKLYSEACLYIGSYYQENGDTDMKNEMYQKSDEYKQMLQK